MNPCEVNALSPNRVCVAPARLIACLQCVGVGAVTDKAEVVAIGLEKCEGVVVGRAPIARFSWCDKKPTITLMHRQRRRTFHPGMFSHSAAWLLLEPWRVCRVYGSLCRAAAPLVAFLRTRLPRSSETIE